MRKTLILSLICITLLSLSACIVGRQPDGQEHKHTVSEWIEDTAATCSARGSRHKECTECRAVLKTEETPRLKHTPAEAVQENFVDSDCENDGSYDMVVYCSVCEKKISDEKKTIEKKGHSPSDWIEDSAATCKAAGSRHRECTECREVLESEIIDRLTSHRPGKGQVRIEDGLFCGDSGKYFSSSSCLDCGAKIEGLFDLPERHSMVNGVCEICGLPQSTTDGLYFGLNPDKKSYYVCPTRDFKGGRVVIGVYNGLSVTEVDGFAGYENLTTINIGDCVKTIGCFEACFGLKNVVIGNGIKEIPEGAFRDCTMLSTVTFGSNVEKIGANAFAGCDRLFYAYISGAHDWYYCGDTIYGEWIGKGMETYFADYLKTKNLEWYRK